MTIAVTGASGQLGRLVVESLKSETEPDRIVALVRSPAKVADLGVEARSFDYARPDILPAALAGIRTLILVSSTEVGQRAEQHRNVIEAARTAGVGRIVYTSLLHADTSELDLAAEHLDTERALATSGIAWTFLRNGWYTENYTSLIPGALANGTLLGSAGNGRISSAARIDFAEAAAVVALQDGHDGRIYELAGDDAWTLSDLAAEVSRQSGQDIPYRNLPQAEYATTLKSAGVPDAFADMMAGWDVAASHGALFDDGHQLSTLIGRPTTPMASIVGLALA